MSCEPLRSSGQKDCCGMQFFLMERDVTKNNKKKNKKEKKERKCQK